MVPLTEAAPELAGAVSAMLELLARSGLLLMAVIVIKLALRYAPPLPRRRRKPQPIDAVWVRPPVPLYTPRGCQHETKHPVYITVNAEPMLVAWICANAKCAESGVYSRWIAHGTSEPEARHAAP